MLITAAPFEKCKHTFHRQRILFFEYLATMLNMFSRLNKRNIVYIKLFKTGALAFFEIAFSNILISLVPNIVFIIKSNQLKQPLLLQKHFAVFFSVLIFG